MSKKSVSLGNILHQQQWHSAMGLDDIVKAGQTTKKAIANNDENILDFISAGINSKERYASATPSLGRPNEFLIHKSTRALWKVSSDGNQIEPAFEGDDILLTGDEDYE